MGGFVAIVAAFCFTFDNVFTRKGLVKEIPGDVWDIRFVHSLASLTLFLIGVIIASFWGFNIIDDFKLLSTIDVMLLIMSGLLGPLLGGYLMTIAIAKIGASHTSALWGGSNPFFTTLFAFLFLGEVPGLIGLSCILLIVVGIVIVGYHSHEGTILVMEKAKISGGISALLAGVFASFSQIARGAALNRGATPNTAFFIFQLTPFLLIILIHCIHHRDVFSLQRLNRKSLQYYSGAGIVFLLGNYLLLVAFTMIPVWQAVGIRSIQPILAIFISWIFLKKIEKINLRLVLGSVLVTIGVILLNFSS